MGYRHSLAHSRIAVDYSKVYHADLTRVDVAMALDLAKMESEHNGCPLVSCTPWNGVDMVLGMGSRRHSIYMLPLA